MPVYGSMDANLRRRRAMPDRDSYETDMYDHFNSTRTDSIMSRISTVDAESPVHAQRQSSAGESTRTSANFQHSRSGNNRKFIDYSQIEIPTVDYTTCIALQHYLPKITVLKSLGLENIYQPDIPQLISNVEDTLKTLKESSKNSSLRGKIFSVAYDRIYLAFTVFKNMRKHELVQSHILAVPVDKGAHDTLYERDAQMYPEAQSDTAKLIKTQDMDPFLPQHDIWPLCRKNTFGWTISDPVDKLYEYVLIFKASFVLIPVQSRTTLPQLDLRPTDGLQFSNRDPGEIFYLPLWCADVLDKHNSIDIKLPNYLTNTSLNEILMCEISNPEELSKLPCQHFFEVACILLFSHSFKEFRLLNNCDTERAVVLQVWDRRQTKVASLIRGTAFDESEWEIMHLQPCETYFFYKFLS